MISLTMSAEDNILALNASAPISPLIPATPTDEDGTSLQIRSLSGSAASVARPSLTKCNTCGTIYLVSTLSDPDKDTLIKCVCGMYRTHFLGVRKDGRGPRAAKFAGVAEKRVWDGQQWLWIKRN